MFYIKGYENMEVKFVHDAMQNIHLLSNSTINSVKNYINYHNSLYKNSFKLPAQIKLKMVQDITSGLTGGA